MNQHLESGVDPAIAGPIAEGDPAPDFSAEARPGNRQLTPVWAFVARWTAISYASFHLLTGGFGALPSFTQRAVHVGFALVLAYILYSVGRKQRGVTRVPWYDLLAIALTLVMVSHIAINYGRYLSLGGSAPSQLDFFVATATLVIVLDAARRVVSPVFSAMVIAGIAYAVFGRTLPDPLTHAGFSLGQILEALFLSTHGLWGIIIRVTSTEIAVFIIFGAFLVVTGGGKAFMDLAVFAAGRSVGGPAKIVVISSALFGTISGAATANIAVTGTFTIPMMKRLGYKPAFAGGMEAAASSGGQIMPPVMGAGAFVMAELLGVPYADIIVAATLPALLFYLCLFFGAHFHARRQNHLPVPASEMPKAGEIFRYYRLAPFFVPIAVMLYLLFTGYTAMYSCFWATATCAILFLFSDFKLAAIRTRALKLLDALEAGGFALVMIVVLCAAASLVVGIIDYTGLGVRLTNLIVSLAAHQLFLALIVAMVITIILGMGLPTVAAYLLGAAIVVPALVLLDVPPLAAHLFVFYYSILAVITPPVCIGVFVAAGIAKADWLETAMYACRMALAGFIIPFMFVFNQELLLQGDTVGVIITACTACIGVVMLAAGTSKFLWARNHVWESIALLAGAVVMIVPGALTDLVGAGALAIVFASQYLRHRSAQAVSRGHS